MTAPDYTIGQTVCVVFERRGGASDVKVTGVGRRWVSTDDGNRFDRVTGHVDGGRYSSPGTVYTSRNAYADALELSNAWRTLLSDLRNTYGAAPGGVTVAGIAEARRLLGMKP